MMDLVVNHTAKDSVLAERASRMVPARAGRHPRRALRRRSGRYQQEDGLGRPGRDRLRASGPSGPEIIAYFAELVRHYVELGFRGFRCDAAYKVPKDVWRTLIAAGRKESDDVLFVAENLGSLLEEVDGDARRRLRLPVQQRQVVGLPRALAARAVREVPLDRAVDRLSGDARHRPAGRRSGGRRASATWRPSSGATATPTCSPRSSRPA